MSSLKFFTFNPSMPLTELPPNMIFVFGSNRRGIHGAGSARSAVDHFGAVLGDGEGLQGRSYAIPTCSVPGKGLHLDDILLHVKTFRLVVACYPTLQFYITAIGCGYAGYTNKDIAPMFKDMEGADRCEFPIEWKPYL